MQHPERAQGWGFQTAPLSLCNQKITQKKKQHRCSSLFTVFSKVNSPIFFFTWDCTPISHHKTLKRNTFITGYFLVINQQFKQGMYAQDIKQYMFSPLKCSTLTFSNDSIYCRLKIKTKTNLRPVSWLQVFLQCH